MRAKLVTMVERLAQIKARLLKPPTIEADRERMEAEAERDLLLLERDLEQFFEPMTQQLDPLINPPAKPMEEDEALQQQVPGGKGAPPAAPKKEDKKAPPAKAPPGKGAPGGKGGPGEAAVYESSLPLPTSGIECLVLLVDHRIETLPFEALKVFQKIPIRSRDFNLHLHQQRVKAIGRQAMAQSNSGVEFNCEESQFKPV